MQWLLLACTMFGLATMHTLGHTGMHGGAGGDHYPPEFSVSAPADVDGVHVLAADAGDGCSGCADDADPLHLGGMPGWAVCVAVLVSAATLALMLMAAHRRRRPERSAPGAARPRPLPRRRRDKSTALLLVTVSVLRI